MKRAKFLPEEMAEYMRARQLTINQLAANTRIPASTLKTYLRGRSTPRQDNLSKVANALRILPSTLIRENFDAI